MLKEHIFFVSVFYVSVPLEVENYIKIDLLIFDTFLAGVYISIWALYLIYKIYTYIIYKYYIYIYNYIYYKVYIDIY